VSQHEYDVDSHYDCAYSVCASVEMKIKMIIIMIMKLNGQRVSFSLNLLI